MNRRTLLPAVVGLASCVGSDPLDSDDPSPAAPDVRWDDVSVGHTDGSDGTSTSGDSGDSGPQEACTLEVPETLTAESLGDGEAEVLHLGVDLPACGWGARTTIDTATRQIAISYVADSAGADCAQLCDTDVRFEASGLTAGTWTILAGLSETTVTIP